MELNGDRDRRTSVLVQGKIVSESPVCKVKSTRNCPELTHTDPSPLHPDCMKKLDSSLSMKGQVAEKVPR